MPEPGEVHAVAWMRHGSDLVADAGVGALQLTVNNPVDYDEDGGTLDVNGTRYDYVTVDQDTGIITLAAALQVAATTGDWCGVVSGGVLAIDYLAMVSLGDGDEVEVPIPYAERDLWPEGDYDNPVLVTLSDDLETIVAVPGRTPLRDGSFIDPSTLPVQPPPPLTDGNPPSTSPVAFIIGGIGALFLRWDAISNHDLVTYEVHLSATTGFTPSPTTKAAELAGTQVTLRTMPDGSPLAYYTDPPANTTPQVYYARIIAKDADGPAPAGAEGNGSMMQVTTPDVAANYVYAGTLVANQIVGGAISSDVLVSSTLRTANTGARVEINSTGLTLYGPDGVTPEVSLPTDPNLPAQFTGTAELAKTNVTGLSIKGSSNEVSKGGTLALAGKVSDPGTPPTVQIGWDSTQLAFTDTSKCKGLAFTTMMGNCWATCNNAGGNTSIDFFKVTGGTLVYRATIVGSSGPDLTWNPKGGLWIDDVNNYVYLLGTTMVDSGVQPTGVETFGTGGTLVEHWVIRKLRMDFVSPTSINLVFLAELDKGAGAYATNPVIGGDTNANPDVPVMAYYGGPTGANLRYATLNPTTLADTTNVLVSSGPPMGGGVPYELSYVQRDTFDYGSLRTLIAHSAVYPTVYAYTGTTSLVRAPNDDWQSANNGVAPIRGSYYRTAGPFSALDTSGKVYRHERTMWTTESAKWWAGYTFNDTNSSGGTHTTGLSSKATFTMVKRAWVTVSTPAIPTPVNPDDVDSAGFYLGRGASEPTDAQMIQNAAPVAGQVSVKFGSVLFTGTGAPTNNFPNSGPGKLVDGAGNTLIDGTGYSMFAPTGCLQMYAGATAPPGWLLCDGSSKVRAAYPALFAVIGTTFGVGTDSPVGTTFSLPDMQRRLPIGVASNLPLGSSDAVTNPTLRSPYHNHDGTATTGGSAHTHNIDVNANLSSAGGSNQARVTSVGGTTAGVSGTGSTGAGAPSQHTHGIPTAFPLTGETDANRAFPQLTLNFIIRT